MDPIFFSNQNEFREWMGKNHASEKELWVGYYKVGSKKPSMTWSQSVDQALCFGWIDGIRKSINEESYCIRFTPRRPKSIWSAVNIKKVEELSKAGLMKAEGLKAFSLRTEDKSVIYSYENKEVSFDPETEAVFKSNSSAWEFFTKQSPSFKKLRIRWVMDAKREETKSSRLRQIISECEKKG